MKKISFDFDNTLSRRSVQKTAKRLIELGYEVHIVTSRFSDTQMYADYKLKTSQNIDLFRVTNHLGIKKEHVHFMNMKNKSEFFIENNDFVFHLDDDNYEINEINSDTTVLGIICDKGQEWKKIIEKLLI